MHCWSSTSSHKVHGWGRNSCNTVWFCQTAECGLFPAADGWRLLTGWKLVSMTKANDPSHTGTEQRWNCDLFLSMWFSALWFTPSDNLGQPVSVTVHPFIHPVEGNNNHYSCQSQTDYSGLVIAPVTATSLWIKWPLQTCSSHNIGVRQRNILELSLLQFLLSFTLYF